MKHSFIRTQLTWLQQHAKQEADGTYHCCGTGKPIQAHAVGRSIRRMGLGEIVEIRQVFHLVCMGCTPEPVLPKDGEPIWLDELTSDFAGIFVA